MANVKRNICRRGSTRDGIRGIQKNERLVVPYLNNDVVANIFSRIPADMLHMNFKHQCKDWSHILSGPEFVHANNIRAKPGLIFCTNELYAKDDTVVGFFELEGLKPKVRELNVFNVYMKFMSSCNGLVLVKEGHWRPHTLSILNPTTKESIRIPECRHRCLWHELVYLSATKEYKLVDMFRKGSNRNPVFHVRSIGGCRNESYCVRVPFRDIMVYSSYNSQFASYCWWNERIAVDGVLYVNLGEQKKLLSLDVRSNLVKLLEVPASGESVRLIELNGSISFVDCVGRCATNCPLNVWILMDLDTGRWEKRYRIESFPQQLYSFYEVLGSLDNGRLIVFASENKIFSYDVNTRQWSLQRSALDGGRRFQFCPRVHVNSLAQIRN